MRLEWLIIELLVVGVAVFELWSLRRDDRAAKKAEQSRSTENPPE